MKKIVALFVAMLMLVSLVPVSGFAAGESYDIIYLTPSTASSFWSQVEVGILQAKADLENFRLCTLCAQVVLDCRKSPDNH